MTRRASEPKTNPCPLRWADARVAPCPAIQKAPVTHSCHGGFTTDAWGAHIIAGRAAYSTSSRAFLATVARSANAAPSS